MSKLVLKKSAWQAKQVIMDCDKRIAIRNGPIGVYINHQDAINSNVRFPRCRFLGEFSKVVEMSLV